MRATIQHLGEDHGLSREAAYALCSVAVDLRIHEVEDAPNWVVGAFLPDDIFTGAGARRARKPSRATSAAYGAS